MTLSRSNGQSILLRIASCNLDCTFLSYHTTFETIILNKDNFHRARLRID